MTRCYELRARLLAAGLGQADVARAAGVSRAAINQVFMGRRKPSARATRALAAATGWEESRVKECLVGGVVTVHDAVMRGREAVKAIGLPWIDTPIDAVQVTPRDLAEMAALRAVLTELLEGR